jgi:hypothetical protein
MDWNSGSHVFAMQTASPSLESTTGEKDHVLKERRDNYAQNVCISVMKLKSHVGQRWGMSVMHQGAFLGLVLQAPQIHDMLMRCFPAYFRTSSSIC